MEASGKEAALPWQPQTRAFGGLQVVGVSLQSALGTQGPPGWACGGVLAACLDVST